MVTVEAVIMRAGYVDDAQWLAAITKALKAGRVVLAISDTGKEWTPMLATLEQGIPERCRTIASPIAL